MAGNRCLRPVQGIALRIARLDAAGATPAGASNLIVTDAFTKVGWAPEFAEGETLTVTNAQGANCVDRKDADKYRWWNIALDLCFPDPEIAEMIAGALLITTTGDTTGAGVPRLNQAISQNGVSLEIWTHALNGPSNTDAITPYIKFVMPKTYNWTIGEQSIENGAVVLPLSGTAIENPGWLNGPANDWIGPSGADSRAIMWMQTATVPASVCGYQPTPAQTV